MLTFSADGPTADKQMRAVIFYLTTSGSLPGHRPPSEGAVHEAVAEGEAQDTFVHGKLKLRCFEIFKSFDQANQEQLMDTIDELIQADDPGV